MAPAASWDTCEIPPRSACVAALRSLLDADALPASGLRVPTRGCDLNVELKFSSRFCNSILKYFISSYVRRTCRVGDTNVRDVGECGGEVETQR